MTDTIFALRWNQSHWMKSSPNFPKAQLVKRNDLWWSEIHCYSEKSEIFRKCLKNIQIFLFLLIIIVVSEADVWKQAIMNNKGQRIMVCSHEIYLYIFSRKKRKNIWPGYEFKLSSFSSTHIHWLPPMGPPNPIYELVIIQTCLLHITQITIAMQGLSSLTNIFIFFSLVFFVDYSWISLFRVKKMDSWLGASDDGSWTIFFYDFLHKDKWWWELNHILILFSSQTKTLEWLTC